MLRHILVSPYHYCGICSNRSNLTDMRRQRGILVDTTHEGCWDNGSHIGEREEDINRVLSNPGRELQPDPKLQEPDPSGEDEVIFNT